MDVNNRTEWVHCPVCGNKTRLQIRTDTKLKNFCAIESHDGYGHPTPLNDTFDFALKTILNGIRDLQGGTEQ